MTNWFIRPSSAGSANGTDWNNAWSITNLSANWASVLAGDTIWFAGGSYNTQLEMGKSGTSGNVITFKRATATSHGTEFGWNATFDTQVVIAPSGQSPVSWSSGVGNFVTIDGVQTNGIKLKYDNTADPFMGGVSWTGSSTYHDIVVRYCDICGPGTGTYGSPVSFNYLADNAPILVKGDGDVHDVTFSYCDVHSGVNLIQAGYIGVAYNWTLEYCRFFDNVVGGGFFHANVFYTQRAHDWTIRYCDFSGWHVEGIVIFATTVPQNFYVYGNIFHDQAAGSPSCFWNADIGGGVDGPLYLYNNTFYGCTITNGQSNDRPFASGSVARNNIYWNSQWVAAISDSDYNFSDVPGTGKGGTHSITTGTNPFLDGPGGNFHIVGTLGATYPRNKGVSFSSPYDVDVDGNTRGADGLWDIGRYEFTETMSVSAYGALTLRTNKPFTATAVNTGITSKRGTRSFTGTRSFVGSLATQINHIGNLFLNITANLLFIGDINRRTARTFTGIRSSIGVLTRSFSFLKSLTATLWGGGSTVLDSYSETNLDSSFTLPSSHGIGQAFSSGTGGTLDSCKFMLNKVLSPPGPVTCKLYATTGTLGTTATPTGTALAVSDSITGTSLPSTIALVTFYFTDANRYVMSPSTVYCISCEYSTVSGSSTIDLGRDNSTPTHAGNSTVLNVSDVWFALNTLDTVFYVYIGAGATSVATLTKRTGKSLSSAQAFVGNLVRQTRKKLISTLSFVGTLVAFLNHLGAFALAVTANLMFVGSLSRKTTKALTASVLSFSTTFVRRVFRSLTSTLTFIGSLVTRVPFAQLFTAVLLFTGQLTRTVPYHQFFTATLTFTGSLGKTFVKTFVATLLFIGALTKRTNRLFVATLSFIGTLVRSFVSDFKYYIDLRPGAFKPTISGNFRNVVATSANFRYVKTNDDS